MSRRTRGPKPRSTPTTGVRQRAPARSQRRAPTAPTGGSKRRRKLSATAGESERVAVWLTRAVAERLRVHAARERMAITVAVEEALCAYLAEKGAQAFEDGPTRGEPRGMAVRRRRCVQRRADGT